MSVSFIILLVLPAFTSVPTTKHRSVVLPTNFTMILPNDCEYSSESSSNPPHASSYPDQYLGATQSSNSTYDWDESQHRESSIAAGQDPQWFSDLISYDSEDSTTEAEAMSVVETSGLVTVDLNNSTSTLPLLDLLPESVPESIGDGVTENTGLYWCPNRVPIPQIHHHICPTCKRRCSSQTRLRDHLRKSHPPPRFICSICFKGCQAKKDIIRHNRTHESSKPTFACSCKKSYKRLDSLRRHIAKMAEVPTETGCHKPI